MYYTKSNIYSTVSLVWLYVTQAGIMRMCIACIYETSLFFVSFSRRNGATMRNHALTTMYVAHVIPSTRRLFWAFLLAEFVCLLCMMRMYERVCINLYVYVCGLHVCYVCICTNMHAWTCMCVMYMYVFYVCVMYVYVCVLYVYVFWTLPMPSARVSCTSSSTWCAPYAYVLISLHIAVFICSCTSHTYTYTSTCKNAWDMWSPSQSACLFARISTNGAKALQQTRFSVCKSPATNSIQCAYNSLLERSFVQFLWLFLLYNSYYAVCIQQQFSRHMVHRKSEDGVCIHTCMFMYACEYVYECTDAAGVVDFTVIMYLCKKRQHSRHEGSWQLISF